MQKVKNKKTKGSATEFGVILEDMNDKFGLVLEYTSEIPKINKKIESIEGKIEVIEETLDVMKADIILIKEDIVVMKADIVVIKEDIVTIKHDLKRKVDMDEFQALEKRVVALENRH